MQPEPATALPLAMSRAEASCRRVEALRIGAALGVAFIADPLLVSDTLLAMQQPERRRLVESGRVGLANHTRRATDGAGDGVSGHAQQYHDLT